MSAHVLTFPTVRRAPAAPPPERSDPASASPLSAPCRFTREARNALNALSYAFPVWGVRFGPHVGDGGEWAAIFDTRGSGHACILVAPEAGGQLDLYDDHGESLASFETPAELITALRRWL